MNEQELLDKQIPVEKLLKPGTIEYVQDQLFNLQDQVAFAQQRQQAANLPAEEIRKLAEESRKNQARIEELQVQLDELLKREQTFKAQGTPEATPGSRGSPLSRYPDRDELHRLPHHQGRRWASPSAPRWWPPAPAPACPRIATSSTSANTTTTSDTCPPASWPAPVASSPSNCAA